MSEHGVITHNEMLMRKSEMYNSFLSDGKRSHSTVETMET